MAGNGRGVKRRRRWKSYRSLDEGLRSWLRSFRPSSSSRAATVTANNAAGDINPLPAEDMDSPAPDLAESTPVELNDIVEDMGMDGFVIDEEDHGTAASSEQEKDEEESDDDEALVDTLCNTETGARIAGESAYQDVRRQARRLLSGKNMTAISTVYGTSQLTARLYGTVRRICNSEFEDSRHLPTYNTLLYTVYPLLLELCFAPHVIISEAVNVDACGVSPTLREQRVLSGQPNARLLITYPSTWLLRDSATLRETIDDALHATGYPKVSLFHNGILEQKRTLMNTFSLLSEFRMTGSDYEYGSFIFKGDMVAVSLIIRDKQFKQKLLQNGLKMDEHGAVVFIGEVGDAKLKDEGTLEDGSGDVLIPLLSTEESPTKAVLQFHVGTQANRWFSSTQLSVPGSSLHTTRLHGISRVHEHAQGTSHVAPPIGVLEDGRPYLSVPYLIFTDDFSTMGGRGGSSGGCYMAPIIASGRRGNGMRNVRVLGLSPPGVSSNAVLRRIVPDIVETCTTGVELAQENGENLVLFIDVVGYIGDYPGMSHCLDIMGHTAASPCTHCTFRRANPEKEEESSRYAYTTSIHSADPAFRRTKQRTRLIRYAAQGNKEQLRQLGLKDAQLEELDSLPLHLLSDKLEEAKNNVLRTRESLPVVSASFDPYQSSIVAPSHVLYGTAQNILNATIKSCTPDQRRSTNKLIYEVLRASGVSSEHNIINSETAKLHSMTINNTFAVLMLAPWAFRRVLGLGIKDPAEMACSHQELLLFSLYKFREMYLETFFIPEENRDGLRAVKALDHSTDYHNRLKRLCVGYIQLVDQLCAIDAVIMGELDRPNIHRLLELYHHSVPRFGHVSLFDELRFEAMHQPLKRALSRSNKNNGQVFSMRSVIANEWRLRMGVACMDIPRGEITMISGARFHGLCWRNSGPTPVKHLRAGSLRWSGKSAKVVCTEVSGEAPPLSAKHSQPLWVSAMLVLLIISVALLHRPQRHVL